MQTHEQIKKIFTASIEAKKLALTTLVTPIAKATEIMLEALHAGHKILSCGNGGSAADAQHFTGEMINRLLVERAPLPAMTLSADTSVLTAIANDYSYEEVFAKQIQALGNPGDILLAISTSGNSANIIKAITTAQTKNMRVIALTGNDGGKIAKILNANDIELRVNLIAPSPRIQEVHILIIHCLCELIEQNFKF